jgi:tetratricopeptide (TPR) repeat protein
MKKNTPNQSQILDSVSSFTWEESHAIQWLTDNGKYLLWATCGAVLLLSFIFYYSGSKSGQAAIDYATAERTFNKLISSTDETQENLSELQAILLKYPEIQPKYDGALAQFLISRGDIEAASSYANRAIERTKAEGLPIYKSYTDTTLLIANNRYDEALQKARELHMRLVTEKTSPTLQAINLLRIAMLQQILGQSEQEKITWKEWQIMAQTNPATIPVLDLMQQGKVSLGDYIQARVNQ